MFLDPLNNEVEQRGGDAGIGGIEVATLLQETNLGSERWRKSGGWVPKAVRATPPASPVHEAEGEQIGRVVGVGPVDRESGREGKDSGGNSDFSMAASAEDGVSDAAE